MWRRVAITALVAVGTAAWPTVSLASPITAPGPVPAAVLSPSPSASGCTTAAQTLADPLEIASTELVFRVYNEVGAEPSCRLGRLSLAIFASAADAQAWQSPLATVYGPWDSSTAILTVTGLAPDTDYWYRADFRGGATRSSLLDIGPVHTLPATGPTCTATYRVLDDWRVGFLVQVDVRNTGPVEIHGWRVTWSLPAGQQVTQVWSAVLSTDGDVQTAGNADYNGTLAPGATTLFGFLGSADGTGTRPANVDCQALA